MVDSRFFSSIGSVYLRDIASLTGASITMASGARGDENRPFTNVAPLDRAQEHDISFLDNVKYIDMFATSQAGACFIRPKYKERAPAGMILLVTEDPYYAYALTTQHFYPEPKVEAGISPLASIAKTAVIGKGVRVDAGAVIGENVTIGDSSWIGANTVLAPSVKIGSHTRIGALCTLSHTIVGNRVVIHRGVHIGQDGFGFAPSPKGILKVPQMGRVLIGNDVEIGSGTCIDRGAGPDTTIGDFTKIDNLVQIGHNVQIGKYVIIVAQCGISGSTQIDDGVQIGGQVGVAGHLKIGAGAKLAARSGLMHDVPAGETYGGAPAIPAKEWRRQMVAIGKLGKKKELLDE